MTCQELVHIDSLRCSREPNINISSSSSSGGWLSATTPSNSRTTSVSRPEQEIAQLKNLMIPWFKRFLCKGLIHEEVELLQEVMERTPFPLELQELIVEFYLSPPYTSILHPLMMFEKAKVHQHALCPMCCYWTKRTWTCSCHFCQMNGKTRIPEEEVEMTMQTWDVPTHHWDLQCL
jgi:hypothetical protein